MTDTIFLCAYRLDGQGGAMVLNEGAAKVAWASGEPDIWIHFNREFAPAIDWLQTESGIDPVIVHALLAPETRPRFDAVPGGVHINLRGINTNEGADPEDMVSIRFFCDGRRLVSARLPRLRAVDDVRSSIAEGRGPKSVGQVITAIGDRLTYRIADLILKMDEQVDSMEESVDPDVDLLGELRRRVLEFRRYVAPQREALARASAQFDDILDARTHAQFAEIRERTARLLDDLDVMRDRTQFIREEIADRRNDRMNRAMYSLSLVAGLFLPLGFMTGLLGINVGGMPGVDDKWAFWIVCLLMVAIGIAAWFLFKRKRWL